MVFRKKIDILKSSKKEITYELMLQFTSRQGLHDYIIEKEVREIMNQDIDMVSKYLEDKFHFKLSEIQEWHKLREFFYRRNVVVHNSGITDSRYTSKVKNTRRGMRLDINNDYLIQSFDVLQRYTEIINAFFYEKYFKS